MRAKNKVVAGYLKEYKFTKRYGKLYMKCLEKEIAVNKMTVISFQVLDSQEYPSGVSMLARGLILSKLFGLIGMITGVATSKKNTIFKVKLTFVNGEKCVAEIDDKIYELIVLELFSD